MLKQSGKKGSLVNYGYYFPVFCILPNGAQLEADVLLVLSKSADDLFDLYGGAGLKQNLPSLEK